MLKIIFYTTAYYKSPPVYSIYKGIHFDNSWLNILKTDFPLHYLLHYFSKEPTTLTVRNIVVVLLPSRPTPCFFTNSPSLSSSLWSAFRRIAVNSRFSSAETNGGCLIQHNSQMKRTYAFAYALFIWLLVLDLNQRPFG